MTRSLHGTAVDNEQQWPVEPAGLTASGPWVATTARLF